MTKINIKIKKIFIDAWHIGKIVKWFKIVKLFETLEAVQSDSENFKLFEAIRSDFENLKLFEISSEQFRV